MRVNMCKNSLQRAMGRVLGCVITYLALASAVLAQVPSASTPPFQPATFMAGVVITPAATTAGDLFCITGSATRLIKVKSIRINAIANTTVQTDAFNLIKRSAVSTGGTLTNPTAVPLDTSQTVTTATATLNAYTGVPTPGAAVGTLSTQYLAISTAGNNTDDVFWIFSPQNLYSDVRLRAAAQQLCVNAPNAYLTNPPTIAVEVIWTEQ